MTTSTGSEGRTGLSPERRAARLRLVEEHVLAENDHDVDATMRTFGEAASFQLNAEPLPGRAAVTAFYAELMQAFPDLQIEVKRRHTSDEAVVLEVVIRGTQRAEFRGIPSTGRTAEFPLCAVFDFDEHDRLREETVYFDSALMLTQLGVLPQPAGG
jgi:steroid delta-isomerase-like uncharacterized protein